MPQTKLHKFTVNYHNSEEYHVVKREIFANGIYEIDLDNPAPRILDVGAHIGLASLYFLSRFPGAQIIAFEPHPENVKLLEQNIWENKFENRVTVEPIAIGELDEDVTLYADTQFEWWSTASLHEGAWTGNQQTTSLSVPARRLSHWLDQSTDLVKIDVEGSEQMIIQSLGEEIKLIKHLLFEFHPHPSQSLTELVDYLERFGFTSEVTKHNKHIDPKDAGENLVLVHSQRF